MAVDIDKLRAKREQISQQVEKLRAQARDLSKEIREAEGPIPDRSHRAPGAHFTIKPATE